LKTWKITNKIAKLAFDSIYDSLIDSFNKFGDEKKYYDFYFLHFECTDGYNDILNHLFNEKNENKPLILTNNLDKLEEHKVKRKSNEFIIICKAINFENLITKSDDRVSDSMKLDEVLKTQPKYTGETNIFQISDYGNDKSFYFYNNKHLVIPEYLVEYNFIPNEVQGGLRQSMEGVSFSTGEMIISSYTSKVDMSPNFYESFNEASRVLYNHDCVKTHYPEGIRKYYPCKNVNINELTNTTFFFIKSSLIQFINFCFPFEGDTFNQKLSELSEKITEIENINNDTGTKSDEVNQVCLFGSKIKEIEFITSINNLVELTLSNCGLEFFDFTLLPSGVIKLDISHNRIAEMNHSEEDVKLQFVDLGFNKVSNPDDILKIIKSNKNLENFNFICNPLKFAQSLVSREKVNTFLTNCTIKLSETGVVVLQTTETNLKQIDLIYDTYSFSKRFSKFSNNSLFLESENLTDSSNDSSILILSKKKLKEIPKDIAQGIQILYLNINKITQIENLTPLTSLQELHMQNNKLTVVKNLNSLSMLKKLDLSNNMIHTIEGISNLKALEWLNVENNVLRSIFITEMLGLGNLVEFHASSNYISNLKECLQLKHLEGLSIVDLSGNDVSRVAEFKHSMIFYLANLKILNKITIEKTDVTLAKEYFDGRLTGEILESKIGNIATSDLLELTLSSCKLKDFDAIFDSLNYPKLVKLDLSRNLFTSFRIFGYLPNLKTLYLSSNLFDKILNKKDKLVQGKGILGLTVRHYV
jgi:hypothetical protein